MSREARDRTTQTTDEVLTIDRVIDASVDAVWNALTDQSHAMSWWAPVGNTITRLEMDVRPGGTWQKCMRLPDGQEVCNGGVYREVVPAETLSFTYSVHGVETLVTITLSQQRGKTMLRLNQSPFASTADRDGHLGGWTSTVGRLAEFVSARTER